MQNRRIRSRKKPKSSGWKWVGAAVVTAAAAAFIFLAAGAFIGGNGLERSLAGQEAKAAQLEREQRGVKDQKEEEGAGQNPEEFTSESLASKSLNESTAASESESKESLLERQLEEIVASMTLEEKVCQLFMVTPEQLTGVGQVTAAGETTRKALEERPVGGLIYFRQNLLSPEQTEKLLNQTAAFAGETEKLPILLAVDEEGGSVTRIGGQAAFGEMRFPNMSEIGAGKDPQAARQVGETIGAYLAKYGFNMDFAPDADVLTNPENMVVKDRSFGSDPQLVWQMASQVAEGLESQGIQPVYKHFPGHGATLGDTHEGFAYTDKTLEELRRQELKPFEEAIDAGADCIMVGHISAPTIVRDNTPSSLSERMVQEILRDEMGFEGVVVTDAMNMGAIQNHYSSAEAAVKAINAGVDMLLMPADFEAARQAVIEAVKSGQISQERIDQSVMRIGRMKLKRQQ